MVDVQTSNAKDMERRELADREQLDSMRTMHATYLKTRAQFERLFQDKELRRDWRDVFNDISHEGNHNANMMENWLNRGKPQSGARATRLVFQSIRLMSFILKLGGELDEL